MSIHKFKKPLHQKTIKNIILADITFKLDIKSISMLGYDDITIEFNNPLSGSETLRLQSMIDAMPLNDPDILIDANMEKITKFTENLIREYGKKNTKRGYTGTQVRQMTADLSEIISLLKGKALPTVLEVLSTFVPTNEITSEDISEFTNDITNFLVKL